ncbi:unnamed protein product, partial [Polarella glacialis]
ELRSRVAALESQLRSLGVEPVGYEEGVVAAGPVTSFLEECRMGQYAQRFEAAGYDDLHTLIYTEERHLKELGMPPGHILKLQ